jgi:RNA recognition motif-containing protein
MNIYVGNLSRDTSEEDLRRAFEGYGTVAKVNVIVDRYTGESRGFGFVEMPSKAEGDQAIEGLNGHELNGQALKVNIAHPRNEGRGRDQRGRGRW